jgi:hypothetical protein
LFALNVTAFLMYKVFGRFGPFHVQALINLTVLLAGFGAVLLKRPRKRRLPYHYYFIGFSYVGLVAAAVSEISARVPGWPWLSDGRLDSSRTGPRRGAATILAGHASYSHPLPGRQS